MTRAISTKPIITRADIAAGYITRYFAIEAQRKTVCEIDGSQLRDLSRSSDFTIVSMRWVIGGNAYDVTLSENTVTLGAESQNKATIEYYKNTIPDLGRLLQNPLEFFVGKYNI